VPKSTQIPLVLKFDFPSDLVGPLQNADLGLKPWYFIHKGIGLAAVFCPVFVSL
jgi:hypothetical protein